jgi:hypothetical protein
LQEETTLNADGVIKDRFYLAINPVATIEFDDAANELYQTLAEINAEAMLGLHDTSRTIRRTVQTLEQQARQADIDRKRLLRENEEAAKIRQELLTQNVELKQKIENMEREAERRETEEDLKTLTAFEKLLNVREAISSFPFNTS